MVADNGFQESTTCFREMAFVRSTYWMCQETAVWPITAATIRCLTV